VCGRTRFVKARRRCVAACRPRLKRQEEAADRHGRGAKPECVSYAHERLSLDQLKVVVSGIAATSMMLLMAIPKFERPPWLLLLKLQRTTMLERSAGNMKVTELWFVKAPKTEMGAAHRRRDN
jgi:hypothetical protein